MKKAVIKRVVFSMVTLSMPVIVLIAAAEIYGTYFRTSKAMYRYDARFGWAPKRNFTYSELHADASGETYLVNLTTTEHGFRAWGKPNSAKIKILFIGDSYTGDPNVSDEDAYFEQVKKRLDVEVFAVGAGGYGTLQEFMLLDDYVDMIDPQWPHPRC